MLRRNWYRRRCIEKFSQQTKPNYPPKKERLLTALWLCVDLEDPDGGMSCRKNRTGTANLFYGSADGDCDLCQYCYREGRVGLSAYVPKMLSSRVWLRKIRFGGTLCRLRLDENIFLVDAMSGDAALRSKKLIDLLFHNHIYELHVFLWRTC
jgi:hypothetical protein